MRVSALFISGGAGLAFSALVWHMRALNQPHPKLLSYYDSSEPFFVTQSLANTMQQQMCNAGSRAVNITLFFIFSIEVALVGLVFFAPHFMGTAFAGMSVATLMKGVSTALIPTTLTLYLGYALLHKSDGNPLLRDSKEILSDGEIPPNTACFSPRPELSEIPEHLQENQKNQEKQKKQKKQEKNEKNEKNEKQITQTIQTAGISLITELDPSIVDLSVIQKGKGQAVQGDAKKQDAKQVRQDRKSKDKNKKQMKRGFAQQNRVPTAYTAPSGLFFSPQTLKTAEPVQSGWRREKKENSTNESDLFNEL
jgi:hypothetical protein